MRKFRNSGIGCKVIYDERSPLIWLNICAFPHILGSPSSYMTLQLNCSTLNFFIYEENFIFFFISVGGGGGRWDWRRKIETLKKLIFLCKLPVLYLKETGTPDRIQMFWQKWIILCRSNKESLLFFWIFKMLLCCPIANAIFCVVNLQVFLRRTDILIVFYILYIFFG